MSSPRAGRAGGLTRGRAGLTRSGSARIGEQQTNRRATSPNPRGGQQQATGGGARPRGAHIGRANSSIRGRGAIRGGQRGNSNSSLQPPISSDGRARGTSVEAQTALQLSGSQEWRTPAKAHGQEYRSKIGDIYQTLKGRRDKDRLQYIREGKISDPEKKTKLSEAITPVGTCQDMCPEYERVTRIYDHTIKGPEMVRIDGYDEPVPDEAKMVKRFQRSAAGDSEQMPSDLRPPPVLQKTLHYLIDKVVNNSPAIQKVQEFVWDRTRAIRNDFSIQQVTKKSDVELAIDCFEKITRYHIYALHATAHPNHRPGVDHSQEIEQLTNTLTSLLKYYDQNRARYRSKNEPEFRAYSIIREIGQDLRPDIETRVQLWPLDIQRNPKVRAALKLYAAASDVCVGMGPLNPKKPATIAKANGMAFWTIVNSPAISYLSACCAETYFRWVRDSTMESIWRAFRRPTKVRMAMLTLSELTVWLGFDEDDQAREYCEGLHFSFDEREDGELVIDLNSVAPNLPHLESSDRTAIQAYNYHMVEIKRHGRAPAAVLRGLSVAQAREQNLLEEADEMDTEVRASPRAAKSASSGNMSQDKPKPAVGLFGVNAPSGPSSNKADASSENPFLKFGSSVEQQSTSPFSNTKVDRLSNPFAKVSQPASGTPSIFSAGTGSSNTSSEAGANPFSGLFKSPPSVGTESPQSTNQAIASKVFSTPSHSLFASKSGTSTPESDQKLFESQKVESGSGLFPNPFAPKAPVSSEPFKSDSQKELSTPQAISSTGSAFTSPFKPPAPSSGLGSSLFSKTLAKEDQAAKEPQSLFKFGTQAGPAPKDEDNESLFLPNNAVQTETPRTTNASSKEQPSLFSQPQAPLFSFNAPTATASAPSSTTSKSLFDAPQSSSSDPSSSNPMTGGAAPSIFNSLPTAPPVTFTSTNASQQPGAQISSTPSSASEPPKQPERKSTSPFATTGTSALQGQKPASTKPLFPSPLGRNVSVPSIEANPVVNPSSTHSVQPGPLVPQSSSQASQTHLNEQPVDRKFQSPSPTNISTPLPPNPSRPSRDQLVDKLIRALVLGPDGLIHQFVESEMGQVVSSCIKKINREKEKEEVAVARRYLLSSKYSRRWRDVAWKRKLRRNAKERRADFRRSLNELATSSRASSRAVSEQPGSTASEIPKLIEEKAKPMAPPPKPILKNKHRGSPPASGLDGHSGEWRMFGESADRPLSKSVVGSSWAKRASNQTSSLNASKINKSSRYSQLSTSMVGEVGIMNERLMKEASRLMDGRTDTTRTDYFKLKALGLDPDTPVVPLTRKRRNEQEIESSVRKSRLSPSKTTQPTGTAPLSYANLNGIAGPVAANFSTDLAKAGDGNDDDLFAQIRAVRAALSETENWYREYREQSERTSVDIAHETEKQRKLREWKPSISRMEARRQREGLPSFLKSSYTRRDTASVERAPPSKAQKSSSYGDEMDVASENDGHGEEDDYVRGRTGDKYQTGSYDEEDDERDGYSRGGEHYDEDDYDSEEDYDEDGGREEGEGEEEDEEDEEEYDTPGYGGSHLASVNAGSEFAARGGTEDDAISL